jgi:hypothetical protein
MNSFSTNNYLQTSSFGAPQIVDWKDNLKRARFRSYTLSIAMSAEQGARQLEAALSKVNPPLDVIVVSI